MVAALLLASNAVQGTARAAEAAARPATPAIDAAANDTPTVTRNGRDIYARFREGLAEPDCEPGASDRWQRHFANAPRKLADSDGDVLPLFGYVVDALREANLPTEYALIPFVESGYRPGARSAGGPAGLWQFIALTARNHKVRMRPGYDGRLSPVESTRAAVRYLKTLHGMFAGDWRLAVMAYNAGEYRVFGALKRSGQTARNARPETLTGLSPITQAYVRKLHALSCVLDRADDGEAWRQAMDRQVAVLAPVDLPAGAANIESWASRNGVDGDLVKRINPAFASGRVPHGGPVPRVLAPLSAASRLGSGSGPTTAAPARSLAEGPDAAPVARAVAVAAAPPARPAATLADRLPTTMADATYATVIEPPTPIADVADLTVASRSRIHVVERGDSIWRIARRYDVTSAALLERNDLAADSVLKPGMTLQIDAAAP